MKRISLFLCMLFAAMSVSAQYTMRVWKSDKSTVDIASSEIDSVTFITTIKDYGSHKFVDLGLPSGLLWAETNIGAKTEADAGYYFAWGETTSQADTTYNAISYKYVDCPDNGADCYDNTHYTKYTAADGKTVLDASDDAACVNWGSSCRMPRVEEVVELQNTDNCTWTWTRKKNSTGDYISGYLIKSVKNGNSIFLPASGDYVYGKISEYGTYGEYWTSTLTEGLAWAYCLNFYVKGFGYYNYPNPPHIRYMGKTIRPVAEP